jgi:hypothetical protein
MRVTPLVLCVHWGSFEGVMVATLVSQRVPALDDLGPSVPNQLAHG